MSLLGLFTTPYSIVRTEITGVDPDTGDDIVASELEADVHPTCYFEQRSSSESNTDRSQVATEGFAAFRAGSTIAATDLVVIDGARWSVVGRPDRLRRRGVEHHVECQLRLVT